MAKKLSIIELHSLIVCKKPLLFLLDYDGTLSHIAPTPDEAVPADGAVDVLENLVGKKEAVLGIISGRPLKELKKFIPIDGIIFVGAHGAFIETNRGDLTSIVDVAEVNPSITEVHKSAVKFTDGKSGFLIEDKKVSVALHFRLADDKEAEAVLTNWKNEIKPLLKKNKLELHYGKKVAEVRPQGADKGVAVNYIIENFCKKNDYPVYIGDDTTDEDAFKVLKKRGLTILVSDVERPTSAQYRIENPDDVVELLKNVADDLE
ncbi:trehalose-phosphatase [bacterium]|nr:trehalose-phosphatase [bacterium]